MASSSLRTARRTSSFIFPQSSERVLGTSRRGKRSVISSSAVSKAHDRASRFKSQLEREVERKDKGEGSDVLKRLISSRSDFAKCKRFEVRVDCYKQCPEIDSDNRLRESSPSWREGC